MPLFTRRRFVRSSLLAAGAAFAASSFKQDKQQVLLSFSTLGCPDWNFDKIVAFAADNHYQGIEMRGILREMDLPKCPEFSSAQSIQTSLQKMKNHNLHFVDLGSSCALHSPKGAEREKNLDEGRRFINLAHKINCPFIRVFPNDIPNDATRNAVMDLIIEGMNALGSYAANSGVRVLIESHGNLVHVEDLQHVLQSSGNNTGLVWDVTNMWMATQESPVVVYNALKQYIFHTHLKDGIKINGDVQYTLLGKGGVPIFKAIDILQAGGYTGYYSFEWEKLWHPEIDAPEIALADYPLAMQRHFNP